MIFNHRLVLTPKEMPLTYLVGWCYKSKAAALLVVQLWEDPEITEPIGATKRVGYWPV